MALEFSVFIRSTVLPVFILINDLPSLFITHNVLDFIFVWTFLFLDSTSFSAIYNSKSYWFSPFFIVSALSLCPIVGFPPSAVIYSLHSAHCTYDFKSWSSEYCEFRLRQFGKQHTPIVGIIPSHLYSFVGKYGENVIECFLFHFICLSMLIIIMIQKVNNYKDIFMVDGKWVYKWKKEGHQLELLCLLS
jgi:hypothetical protein